MKEIFENSTSINEVIKKLNLLPNGRSYKKVKEEALLINFDLRLLNKRYKYNLKPNFCLCCKKKLSFLKRTFNFCSQSCSAKITNIGKIKSKITIEKIKNKLLGNKSKPESIEKLKKYWEKRKILKPNKIINKEVVCKICKNKFINITKNLRKTCSRECQTHASVRNRPYQNGSRKNIYYNHRTLGQILLESTWELKIAEYLDINNIEWIRPKYLKWIDDNKKSRLYYPDFYLPNYDIYIDPKNPYCLERDKEKLEYFKNKIILFYGNVDKVIEEINIVVAQRKST